LQLYQKWIAKSVQQQLNIDLINKLIITMLFYPLENGVLTLIAIFLSVN